MDKENDESIEKIIEQAFKPYKLAETEELEELDAKLERLKRGNTIKIISDRNFYENVEYRKTSEGMVLLDEEDFEKLVEQLRREGFDKERFRMERNKLEIEKKKFVARLEKDGKTTKTQDTSVNKKERVIILYEAVIRGKEPFEIRKEYNYPKSKVWRVLHISPEIRMTEEERIEAKKEDMKRLRKIYNYDDENKIFKEPFCVVEEWYEKQLNKKIPQGSKPIKKTT